MAILLWSKPNFRKNLKELLISEFHRTDIVVLLKKLFDKKDDRITIISEKYKNQSGINAIKHHCQTNFSFTCNTIEQKDNI